MARKLSRLPLILVLTCCGFGRLWGENAAPGYVHANWLGESPASYNPTPDQEDVQQSWGRYGVHNSPQFGLDGGLKTGSPSPSSDSEARRPRSAAVPVESIPSPAARPSPARKPVRTPGGFFDGLLGLLRDSRKNSSPAPSSARKEPAPPAEPVEKKFALWSGLNSPMRLPARKVDGVSPDEVKTQGRADYDQHILALKGSPAPLSADAAAPEGDRPADTAEAEGAAALPAAAGTVDLARGADARPAPGDRGLFVAMELDIGRTPGEYRDAVGQLSKSAGFSIDDRFPPVFKDGLRRTVSLRGWLPAGRFADAMRAPGVNRMEVERGANLAPAGSAAAALSRSQVFVALRLPGSGDVKEAFSSALLRLSSQAGFVWKRTAGFQELPGGTQALIIAGEVPVRNIGRLLAEESVLRIFPGAAPAARTAEAERAAPRPAYARFLSFVLDRHPYLLLAVLLPAFALTGFRPRFFRRR